LSIPSFLPKLVDVAVREPYEPRFPNIANEIDHWMRIIDDSISARIVGGADADAAVTPAAERRNFDLIGGRMLERVDVSMTWSRSCDF
jgi:hypothetical protein